MLAGSVVEELLLLGLHRLANGVGVEELEALDKCVTLALPSTQPDSRKHILTCNTVPTVILTKQCAMVVATVSSELAVAVLRLVLAALQARFESTRRSCSTLIIDKATLEAIGDAIDAGNRLRD